jgi:LCP family protein required for cell wall assembly
VKLNGAQKKRAAWGIAVSLAAVLALGGAGLAVFGHIFRQRHGEQTGADGSGGVMQSFRDMRQVAIAPREGFPGRHKLTLLCMGIDDNWTNGDQLYTAQARTDTLFLLSLDLDNKKVAMLSIPRDTYTHIAGTPYSSKINSAYATGGPKRSLATVDELLGVRADHYLVLNIDATKKIVGALGGVDVNVENEMHYHDKWGHLSIDLKPGFQHLDADQAVGFARYRHGDAGARPSPEDGDERRMYRQHVLMQAIIAKAKNFANVAQAPHLVDVAMSTIQTDLTRTQLFDLAAIYRGVQPGDIRTASLTGDSYRGAGGGWDYRLDLPKAHAYVDWLIKGEPDAARPLVPIVVKNGTNVSGLALRAAALLKKQGYRDITVAHGAAHEAPAARTTIIDGGVVSPAASADVASLLGLVTPDQTSISTPGASKGTKAALTVTLGQDYAQTDADEASAAR